MHWYYLIAAYAAVGITFWVKVTIDIFRTLGGEDLEKVPMNLKEEIKQVIEEINQYESPLLWLFASVLIIGAITMTLIRYTVTWPLILYRRRNRV